MAAIPRDIQTMKKGIGLFATFFVSLSASGQVLVMNQLGPKAGDEKEVIKEFKNFIVYKGDTLNRRDDKGLKEGEWIEYRKAYLQRTNGAITVTDSTNASYVIEMRGRYTKGKRSGPWNSYFRDGKIKDSKKYD